MRERREEREGRRYGSDLPDLYDAYLIFRSPSFPNKGMNGGNTKASRGHLERSEKREKFE